MEMMKRKGYINGKGVNSIETVIDYDLGEGSMLDVGRIRVSRVCEKVIRMMMPFALATTIASVPDYRGAVRTADGGWTGSFGIGWCRRLRIAFCGNGGVFGHNRFL